jgi:large subunit ribosomal protein L21
MFAIIKTGGKQYKVATNDVIMVEKLAGSAGDLIEFKDVLMMGQGNSIKVGAPLVADATVCGTVLDQIRDDKVIIFKKKRRHNYRRKNGHRQYLTVVRITDILSGGAAHKAKASPEKVEEKTKAPEKKVGTTKKAEAPKAAPIKKAESVKKTDTSAKGEKPAAEKKAAPTAKKTTKS